MMNLCKLSARSNIVCCNVKASRKRLPSSSVVSSCVRLLSTQQCQLGASTKRSDNITSEGVRHHVRSRPVRTENAEEITGETPDIGKKEDGSFSDRNETYNEGDERLGSDFMDSYAKAKERVQEGFDKVRDSVSLHS